CARDPGHIIRGGVLFDYW
nr:immunoglobulin heavy chain junction region [Macaca mulatta]